jgi:lysylphosphatidylglycerol synthase-like protein
MLRPSTRADDIGTRRSVPSPSAVVGGIAGVLLFAYALRVAGLQNVADGVRRTGIGFVWVLLLSGLRYLLRCYAWRLCVEEPEGLSTREAFVAFIAGDAVGNLTLFGPVASEGTKAIVVTRHLPTLSALSSIALENIFYALSVAIMVGIGTLVFLNAFQLSPATQAISFASAAAALTLGSATLLLLYRKPRVLTGMAEWTVGRTSWPGLRLGLRSRVDSIRELEDRIHRFASSYPSRVPRVLLFELAFHAAAVAEIYVLLMLLLGGSARTLLLESIVLETVNRLITIVFKFVPMRIGVDEAGSGLATQVLISSSGVGVTIAIVRKARTLFWAAIGVLLLIRRGVRVRGGH